MNILNVGYDSTNYYLLDLKDGRLLVDCGWPGTLPKFLAVLRRKDVSPDEIKYLLVTHFHPDHSGLAQEVKNLGASLIVLERQADFTGVMDELYRSKNLPYSPISPDKNIMLPFAESRDFLARQGLEGEVIPTPYHSPDSVTLLLDEGFAFTGDLPVRFMIPDDDQQGQECWDRIYARPIHRIFPGHGEGG